MSRISCRQCPPPPKRWSVADFASRHLPPRPTEAVARRRRPAPAIAAPCSGGAMSRSSPLPRTRRLPASSRNVLARHIGIHLAAFSSADAAGEHRRLADAGFPVLPLVDMRRPVATENGEEDARFTIARIMPGAMPEGRIQFLTHHTEHLVWREPYLDHPNGAQALTALWIAAADPDEPAQRFARFTGRAASRDGVVLAIGLDRGSLRFASPRYLEREFGIIPGPPLPYLAAYEIEVAALDRVSSVARAAGITVRRLAQGIAITLPASIGGTIIFRARAD